MKNKKFESRVKEYKNVPPKEIFNAIHGSCFDYQNYDKRVFNGESVQDRGYMAWQTIHLIIKRWINADQQNFIDYINKNEPDMSPWEQTEENEKQEDKG